LGFNHQQLTLSVRVVDLPAADVARLRIYSKSVFMVFLLVTSFLCFFCNQELCILHEVLADLYVSSVDLKMDY